MNKYDVIIGTGGKKLSHLFVRILVNRFRVSRSRKGKSTGNREKKKEATTNFVQPPLVKNPNLQSTMVRKVTVTVPLNEHPTTLSVLQSSDHVHGLATFYGEGVSMLTFTSDERKLQATLRRLNRIGAGSRFGTVDVAPLVATMPTIRRGKGNRKYRIDDRMSVEEIRDAVDAGSRLTFDFLAMTSIAAIMSGSGLVGDSGTTVVASMLVSPLMGPLLCATFGVASGDMLMAKRGAVNAAVGTLLCLAVGLGVGAASLPYYAELDVPTDWNDFIANDDLVVSSEMIERGTPGGLLMGFAIAVPSGVGVTLAVTTSGGINALVGVAISAALVPPVVNAGICIMTGAFLSMMRGESEVGRNFLILGGVSIALYLVNIFTMVLVGVGMMKVKKVTTVGADNEAWNADMLDATGSRSSFFRAGLELGEMDDATSPLVKSRTDVGRVPSDPYSGWWGGAGDEDEDEDPDPSGRPGRIGGALAAFMKKNGKALQETPDRKDEKRDSVDMFSPNNFGSDLRSIARSIGESDWGVVDGGPDGAGGGGDEATFAAGAGGGGFRLDDDPEDEEDWKDAVRDDGDRDPLNSR